MPVFVLVEARENDMNQALPPIKDVPNWQLTKKTGLFQYLLEHF
jgi:hypothetical protein